MNTVVTYVRSFMALFLVVMVLRQMIAGEGQKKYIYFFSELILALGFLYPVLSVLCDSDTFLQMIRYEEFAETLSEASRNVGRVDFLQETHYREQYEKAAELDVQQTAERMLAAYGLQVSAVDVQLSEQYEIKQMALTVCRAPEESAVPEIFIGEEKKQGQDALLRHAAEELCTYYHLPTEAVTVRCEGE